MPHILFDLNAGPVWDARFFKVLSRTDTGESSSNSAAIVITKPLVDYFPHLELPSPGQPTAEHPITVALFKEAQLLIVKAARYHYQTRGGSRTPEPRLTGLAPLRNLAREGDLVLFDRNLDHPTLYKLTLVHKASDLYAQLSEQIGGRPSGVLVSGAPPVLESELQAAVSELLHKELMPFQLFQPTPNIAISNTRRLARAISFRKMVLEEYAEQCAICGEGLRSPGGWFEVDAAHVVPHSLSGADDVRNGIALCKQHHWAFDRGLFGISPWHRKVIVPDVVKQIPENKSLCNLDGHPIREAANPQRRTNQDAFAWHNKHVVVQASRF
jgi:putative restriction endonuclease